MPVNTNPMDIAIAGLINSELKACCSTSAVSACACSSPELRQEFARISQEGIQRQAQLSSIMTQKGWYVAPESDAATINMLVPQLQAAAQGVLGGTVAGTPVVGAYGTVPPIQGNPRI